MAVLRTTFFSNSLRRLKEMTAIVPVERAAGIPEELRAKSDSPMKTVMLLHGYSGTHSDWLYGSRIEQLAMKYHIAVLCPSGENGFYVDDRKRDALYEQLLCEVIDFGRRVFPLSCKREDTIIGGFSMGGYGALINGFKHPELFGGVIALSAAAITDDLAKMDSYEDNPAAMASPSYYEHIDVKRGLRNADGTGVMAGITQIGNVQGYYIQDGERVPMEGRLIYRGISIEDLIPLSYTHLTLPRSDLV